MSHYKKDGTLDMHFSSSKATVASGYYSGGGAGASSSYGGGYSSYSSYTSYGGRGGYPSCPSYTSYGDGGGSSSSGLHYKKDGTLDMRYASSKAASGSGSAGSAPSSGSILSQDLHYKKDGTLDMRFTTSKEVSKLGTGIAGMAIRDIPVHLPRSKCGLPDMRTKAGKEWVQAEAHKSSSISSSIPDWIPRKKDGSPDLSKAVAAEYFHNIIRPPIAQSRGTREEYYAKRMMENDFRALVEAARIRVVTIPPQVLLPETQKLEHKLRNLSILCQPPQKLERSNGLLNSLLSNSSTLKLEDDAMDTANTSAAATASQIPASVPVLDYQTLKNSFGDETTSKLGQGSFGVVLKGRWNGADVAVKRLHLTQLNRKETTSFTNELYVMATLGAHKNLVKLIGYTLEPPCLVMEFIKLGSLSYVLHISTDKKIEADIMNGQVKKLVLTGIVDGMQQLHAVGIVHGDLKPANVLLTEDYTAKITDFGLSTLRGKSSCSIATASIDDGENVVGGTGGYMATELLDSSKRPELSSDVYSFGILLNEVLQEEEPYEGHYGNFLGRGPFAAVNYAKLGNRPNVKSNTPQNLRNLIQCCWNSVPGNRPTFDKIAADLRAANIPHSI